MCRWIRTGTTTGGLRVRYRSSPGPVHTQENYRWAIEGHLVPGLGRIRLARLTADDVDVLLEDRAASGRLARSSVGRLRTVLGKALDHTERRNLVRGTWSGLPTCRRGRLRPGGR